MNGVPFDEAWYLAQNPDIAEAVSRGVYASGEEHYHRFGCREGRLPAADIQATDAFDAVWYEASYHAAAQDIAAGRAKDALDHFERYGRARGYLPNRFAERPDDPARQYSGFGGLWTDHRNALDLIDGRLELGKITAAQADLLRHWVTHGYVILPQAVTGRLLRRAMREVQDAYAGKMPSLRFECPSIGGYNPVPWDAAVQEKPAKALDLHWWSGTIRKLIFADPIREFLELLFDRRALATQSLTFWRGSAQGYHQDTLYVPYTMPTQFAASWIALEDVTEGAGELTYYEGSHRLPDILHAGRYKTLWDAQRLTRSNSLRDEMKTYSPDLEQRAIEAGYQPRRFLAKKGDVLIWHADLVHGGRPISQNATRNSVVTHYCPREVAPMVFERGNTAMRAYRDVAYYATGYYASQQSAGRRLISRLRRAAARP